MAVAVSREGRRGGSELDAWHVPTQVSLFAVDLSVLQSNFCNNKSSDEFSLCPGELTVPSDSAEADARQSLQQIVAWCAVVWDGCCKFQLPARSIWMCCCPTPYIPCSPNESDASCLSGDFDAVRSNSKGRIDWCSGSRAHLLDDTSFVSRWSMHANCSNESI